jgi:RNA polymerase sigma-70 factor (ECF subfamily)
MARSRADADLTRLYAVHGPRIRAHCSRLLGDRASGEDATHDVFMRVGRLAGSVPAPEEIRPWLFRIATNHCLNELRSRNVRARTPPQLSEATRDQQDVMAARNDARRLLERLPPRARTVALLIYVDGMVQHEVAETLGVSRRTVVNYLSRVRACLESGAGMGFI